jgi:hypothetical protein
MELLTITQYAKRKGISRQAVFRKIQIGKLEVEKIKYQFSKRKFYYLIKIKGK